jgi:hypothetical protein
MKKKIYKVDYKGYMGIKYYNTEEAFLKAIGNNTNAIVTIYEEIESGSAFTIKNDIIITREREEQLKSILEDDSELNLLFAFKERVVELLSDIRLNGTAQFIIREFETCGLSKKTFKKIANNYKETLLYLSHKDVEWFKILFSIHNFTVDGKIKSSKYSQEHRKHIRTFIDVDKEIIDNIKEAKKQLKNEGINTRTKKK